MNTTIKTPRQGAIVLALVATTGLAAASLEGVRLQGPRTPSRWPVFLSPC